MNSSDDMRRLGRLGGRATTDKKIAASRANAEKARLALATRRGLAAQRLSALDEVEQPLLASDFSPSIVATATPEAIPDTSMTAPDEATYSPPPAARPATATAPVRDTNRPVWPQWPLQQVLRSPFEIEVRALHRRFNLFCRCKFCT